MINNQISKWIFKNFLDFFEEPEFSRIGWGEKGAEEAPFQVAVLAGFVSYGARCSTPGILAHINNGAPEVTKTHVFIVWKVMIGGTRKCMENVMSASFMLLFNKLCINLYIKLYIKLDVEPRNGCGSTVERLDVAMELKLLRPRLRPSRWDKAAAPCHSLPTSRVVPKLGGFGSDSQFGGSVCTSIRILNSAKTQLRIFKTFHILSLQPGPRQRSPELPRIEQH